MKNLYPPVQQAVLRPKSQDKLMRFCAWFLGQNFMTQFWTTYRLPFGRAIITHPDHVDPQLPAHQGTVQHELVHVAQFSPWWGPWWVISCVVFFPLPVLFSGRWWIERRPYLIDIVEGRRTINQAVDVLWKGYGYCWPRRFMRAWFSKNLKKHRGTWLDKKNDSGATSGV